MPPSRRVATEAVGTISLDDYDHEMQSASDSDSDSDLGEMIPAVPVATKPAPVQVPEPSKTKRGRKPKAEEAQEAAAVPAPAPQEEKPKTKRGRKPKTATEAAEEAPAEIEVEPKREPKTKSKKSKESDDEDGEVKPTSKRSKVRVFPAGDGFIEDSIHEFIQIISKGRSGAVEQVLGKGAIDKDVIRAVHEFYTTIRQRGRDSKPLTPRQRYSREWKGNTDLQKIYKDRCKDDGKEAYKLYMSEYHSDEEDEAKSQAGTRPKYHRTVYHAFGASYRAEHPKCTTRDVANAWNSIKNDTDETKKYEDIQAESVRAYNQWAAENEQEPVVLKPKKAGK